MTRNEKLELTVVASPVIGIVAIALVEYIHVTWVESKKRREIKKKAAEDLAEIRAVGKVLREKAADPNTTMEELMFDLAFITLMPRLKK